MAGKFFNKRKTGTFAGSDTNITTEGRYATDKGHLLEFTDVRNSKNYISFIAFLTSFTQNFASSWNQEEVMGRMDPIATFKNTKRTISIGWDIPAGSESVAKENLARCNKLTALLYPSYSKQTPEENALAMSRPPLIRLKYANLVDGKSKKGLLGFITSCDLQPILEMGSFSSGDGNIYPKVLSVSISFQVLHEQTIGYSGGTKKMGEEWPFRTGGVTVDSLFEGDK